MKTMKFQFVLKRALEIGQTLQVENMSEEFWISLIFKGQRTKQRHTIHKITIHLNIFHVSITNKKVKQNHSMPPSNLAKLPRCSLHKSFASYWACHLHPSALCPHRRGPPSSSRLRPGRCRCVHNPHDRHRSGQRLRWCSWPWRRKGIMFGNLVAGYWDLFKLRDLKWMKFCWAERVLLFASILWFFSKHPKTHWIQTGHICQVTSWNLLSISASSAVALDFRTLSFSLFFAASTIGTLVG